MAVYNRSQILTGDIRLLSLAIAGVILQGCGLVVDAVQLVRPIASDELQTICARRQVQVGMSIEPLRPFVFPAIFTDEGLRVTGLDVELVREIAGALTQHCGVSIVPVLHLVRFRNLFVELSEHKVDLFVSAVSAYVPSPTRAGFAYSIPYFYEGGLTAITRRTDVIDRVRSQVRKEPPGPDPLEARKSVLKEFTVAVQEGAGSHRYAEAQLGMDHIALCDSLPAAFESDDPAIDLILGKWPVLEYMSARVRTDWKMLTLEDGTPLLLTRGHYTVVMAEESYRLRWFVNDVLFRLDESGRLAQMRRRWLVDEYAYPRRAAAEGLSFDPDNMPKQYDQGQCRWAIPR
ncbi:MAG: substrate-binding periplasmic protein [Nitrospiraceae bacterium]